MPNNRQPGYEELPLLSEEAGQTESISLARSRVPVQHFVLSVRSGPDSGADYWSAGSEVVIGTHARADWRLTDPSLSRFHCRLFIDETGAVGLEDLGSRNGSRVDGVLAREVRLERRAVLVLGRNTIDFSLGAIGPGTPLSESSRFGALVGEAPEMRAVFGLLEAAAASDATLLLFGETGTGKELAAEAVHARSRRANGPFVVVDCGAMPPSLISSELFGHARGAFTGATSDRSGAFETADGGTLFLDEIGELPLELQPQLLRALDRRSITRVGEDRSRPVDVRVIAATHRDIRRDVNRKTFRPDLFYRLAVLMVTLPPLRKRPSDIPLLLEHLCQRIELDAEVRARLFEPTFLAALTERDWPGNVRELRNLVERMRISDSLTQEREPKAEARGEIDLGVPLRALKESLIGRLESEYLRLQLAACGNNIAQVAETSGLSRMQVYRLLQKYDLRK